MLRDYFPQIFQSLRKKFPGLKLTLREDYQAGLENLLRRGEIDLAVTPLETKSGAGIQTLPLVELPLVLLAPKESKITEAGQLWRRDKITETLICLPADEMVSRNFQQGLAKLGVDWFPGIETSALDLIATYVAGGFGLGVSVAIPQVEFPRQIRADSVAGFCPGGGRRALAGQAQTIDSSLSGRIPVPRPRLEKPNPPLRVYYISALVGTQCLR